MKDIIFTELRSIYQKMTPEQEAAAARPAAHCIGMLEEFSNIQRRKGLLALDGYVQHYDDFLSRMAVHLGNGTDWEEVENIGLAEYFSRHLKKSPVDRLMTLISLAGLELFIQNANPHILEEHLLAMSPEGTEKLVDEEFQKSKSELAVRLEKFKKETENLGEFGQVF